MIEITEQPISPGLLVDSVRSNSSGCVVTYVGVIRDIPQGSAILSVECQDSNWNARKVLLQIANEAKLKWQVEKIAISRRVGKLNIGEINHVVAVASAHRSDGFAACQYIIDQFKKRPPIRKIETYQNGSIVIREAFQEQRNSNDM